MTNLLLDIEPRDPAPRCPHCPALEARVERLRRFIEACDRMIGEYDNLVTHLLAAYDDIRPMPDHMAKAQDLWRAEYKRFREESHRYVSLDLTDAAPEVVSL